MMFTNVATFHMNGHVNRHNCHTWRQEQSQEILKHVQDSPEVHVHYAGIMQDCAAQPFFFAEKTITANMYHSMLQLSSFHKLLAVNNKKKKKVKFCFNNTVLHPATSVMGMKCPKCQEFLSVHLKSQTNTMAPTEPRHLTTGSFSVGIHTQFNLWIEN